MAKNNRRWVWYYTFYDAKTDDIIYSGLKEECMEKMGCDKNSFHSTISKVKRGDNKKYVITVEDLDTGKFVVYGQKNADYQKQKVLDFDSKLKDAEYYYGLGYNDRMIAEKIGLSINAICKWRRRNNKQANRLHEKKVRESLSA